MTKAENNVPAPSLADLRQEIDGIDRALHTLLIERGEIIDRLIAVKARQGGGSAFRPAREAEMMRRLVTRHRGILPLDTIESIWRIIISTFTYVQAPYAVHADMSGGDAPMRDACRFHFGFTVPLETHPSAADVVARVAAAGGDLGLVRVDAHQGAWWEALAAPQAPKVIARLPFVERGNLAAGLPVYVIAKPPEDPALDGIVLHAVAEPAREAPSGVEVVAAAEGGRRLLVAAPGGCDPKKLAEGFAAARVSYIGSHAARFEIARETA